MPEKPQKVEVKRKPDGTFQKGYTGNPGGRPPGKSLKTYWRERFQEMTDEEKAEFSKKVDPALLWQMAEGRPRQDTDITTGGDKLTVSVVSYADHDPARLPAAGVPEDVPRQ